MRFRLSPNPKTKEGGKDEKSAKEAEGG